MERPLYTREEEALLTSSLARGDAVQCPRCRITMERQEVVAEDRVPYVRHRLWLTCGGCGRSLVVDRGRLKEEGS